MAKDPERAPQRELWLKEHLPYQVMMMRHTYARLFKKNLDALDWNAMYMAFAVSSRNLVLFFTNRDKKESKTNFGAAEFIDAGFGTSSKEIETPMKCVRAQIFHLDKARPADANEKFQLSEAKEVMEWIEVTLRDFKEKLSPDDQKLWNITMAPETYVGLTLKIRDAPFQACTAGPQTASSSYKTN